MRQNRDINFIVVHHSGNGIKNLDDIDRIHRARGWAGGCGYDYVIDKKGSLEISSRWDRKYHLIGAHCHIRGDRYNTWNRIALSVCVVGDFRKEHPTPIQNKTLLKFLLRETKKFNIPPYRILTHREIKNTACPGKNLQVSIDIIRKELIKQGKTRKNAICGGLVGFNT